MESPPVIATEVRSALLARRTRHTLHALIFGSLVCVALLTVRIAYAGRMRFSYLYWNLFLAWIPLLLALYLRRSQTGTPRLKLVGTILLWFLFFPNCFYLVTDLIHGDRFGMDGVYRWYDLLVTSSFSCGGLFLGSLSLYLLQLSIRERLGWRIGWLFATAMLALASFGIYLGRFLRLNSWDAVVRPWRVWSELSRVASPPRLQEALAFTVAFFFFSLAIYSFVVSIARLHESRDA